MSKIFNVPVTEIEPVIKPYSILDNFRWETVTLVDI